MLSVLSRMRWVVCILAIITAALGVVALVQGSAHGWVAIGIALLCVTLQRYLNTAAGQPKVTPRDKVG